MQELFFSFVAACIITSLWYLFNNNLQWKSPSEATGECLSPHLHPPQQHRSCHPSRPRPHFLNWIFDHSFNGYIQHGTHKETGRLTFRKTFPRFDSNLRFSWGKLSLLTASQLLARPSFLASLCEHTLLKCYDPNLMSSHRSVKERSTWFDSGVRKAILQLACDCLRRCQFVLHAAERRGKAHCLCPDPNLINSHRRETKSFSLKLVTKMVCSS